MNYLVGQWGIHVGLVFLGGGLGATARYLLIRLGNYFGLDSLWPVLGINILGSFIFGWALSFGLGKIDSLEEWRLLILTGLLGGFTTYSAFSADALRIFEDASIKGVGYLVVSVLGGIGFMWVGVRLGRIMIES